MKYWCMLGHTWILEAFCEIQGINVELYLLYKMSTIGKFIERERGIGSTMMGQDGHDGQSGQWAMKTREQVRVCSGFTDSTEEEETRKSCGWSCLTSTGVEEISRETPHTPNLLGTRRPLVCERGSQKILDQLTKTKPKLRPEFLLRCYPGPSSPPLPHFDELPKKTPVFTSVRGHTT